MCMCSIHCGSFDCVGSGMTLFSDNIIIDKILSARDDQNKDCRGLILTLASEDNLTIQLKFTGIAREELIEELGELRFCSPLKQY